MLEPIAKWNESRDCWEEPEADIFGHSDVYSETFPASGMTRAGLAFALPKSGHLTTATESSSSLETLLPTPAAMNPNDGETFATWEAPRQRVIAKGINGNGFGTPLAIAVQLMPTPLVSDANGSSADHRRDHLPLRSILLPTPRTTDSNGPGLHGTGGMDLRTAIALLPTPTTQDAANNGGPSQFERNSLPLNTLVMTLPGVSTDPPSVAGKQSRAS